MSHSAPTTVTPSQILSALASQSVRVGGCMIWHGFRSKDGYGLHGIRGVRERYVHRAAYVARYGAIPPETPIVMHSCDTPACWADGHLSVGTTADNMRDKAQKGRARNGYTGPLPGNPRLFPTRPLKPTTAQRLGMELAQRGPGQYRQDELASSLSVSERSVRRSLVALEQTGFIRRERRVDAFGHRAADMIIPIGQNAKLSSSLERHSPRKVSNWTPEVIDLRRAMLDAGITCGWSNLRDDVVADLTRWVRTLGISKLVREAKSRIWNAVRHVGAFLRFWRELRPERRPSCPFHPAESTDHGRRCPQCAERPSARMPVELREGRWRSRRSLIQSA